MAGRDSGEMERMGGGREERCDSREADDSCVSH